MPQPKRMVLVALRRPPRWYRLAASRERAGHEPDAPSPAPQATTAQPCVAPRPTWLLEFDILLY